MPGREPLSSLANLPALEAEQERIIGFIRNIQEAISGVRPLFDNYKKSGGAGTAKGDTDALAESVRQLAAAQKALEVEQAKGLTLETNLAKQLAIKKELNKAAVTDMRAEAREAAGLNDAYKKLELQYNAAQRAAKNLAATPGASQAAIDAANKQALALANQLKAVDGAVGQHQRNVGNYVGAISILEKSLGEVKGKLDQFTQSGNTNSAEAQKLKQEYELLSSLVNQQAKGFTSLTMEVRANERALQTLRAAGMEGTESFEQLQLAVAKAHRQMNEFQKSQKLLESAAPNLAALTTVAKGLGGAYAFGAGASALFADGNEKVEKELNKLVAIMTILQGLNELHELAEKKGAIATLFNAGAQRLKNFAMTGSASGIKSSTAATTENTTAETINTDVKEVNAVASEENAAAQVVNAEAIGAVTVATEGASAAMVGLRIALIATGIGALLILLPLLAEGMDVFGNKEKEAAKKADELADSLEKMNRILVEEARLADETGNRMKKYLENSLMLSEKAKQNFYDQQAIKQHILDLDQKMAENDLKKVAGVNDVAKAYQTIDGQVKKLESSLDPLLSKQKQLNEISDIWKKAEGSSAAYFEIYKKYGKNITEDQIKDQLASNEKQIEATKKTIEEKRKLTDQYDKVQIDQVAQVIDTSRFSQEEQSKILASGLKDKAERIMENNKLILSGEKITLQQRISAMRSNLSEQKAIIEAEKNEKLSDPSLTPSGRALIVQEAGQAEYKATLESKESINKAIEDAAKRNKEAAAEIQKLEIEDGIRANDEILNNEKSSYQQRTAALADSYLKRRVISGVDMFKELEGLAPDQIEERKAILAKYDSEVLAQTVEFHKKQQEEAKRAQAKAIADAVAAGDERKAKILTAQAEAEIALNGKKPGLGKDPAQEKKDLAFKYNEEILQNQINTDFLLVNSTKEGTKERADAEAKLAEDRMKLSDLVNNKLKDDEKRRIDTVQHYAEEGEKVARAIVDGQFQHELNVIQDRINENTKLADKQKSDVANSTLNAQQKAAQLIVIGEQQKIKEDQLMAQKRAAELKQAKFDRDADVLKIIGSTFASAAKAGFLTPAGIAIEVAGAVAVTELLAKPLPHFAKGTGNAPRGWGVWGEAGQEAKIDTAGNVEFSPNRATPVYLRGGEKIIPHDELNRIMYNNMLQATATMIIPGRQDESAREIKRLNGELRNQTRELKNSMENQRVNIRLRGLPPGWDAYITKAAKE